MPTAAAPTASGGDASLEASITSIGNDYLEHAKSNKTGLLSAAFWSDKLMDWAMKDEAFKVQLFRFVDAFPMLLTPAQVHDHLVDYLTQPDVTPPPGLAAGLKAGGLLKGTMSRTVAKQIESMASRFIAGTDAASAVGVLEKLWSQGVAFSVDLLGEACLSDAEAAAYQERYLDLVDTLPLATADWTHTERLETNHLGPIPRTNVSIKISSLYARTDPIDTTGSIDGLVEALRPILEHAAAQGVFVNFDIEHHAIKDLTLDLFMRCCEEVDFEAGLAMQAYLRSGDEDVARVIGWSQRTGRQATVRLVKGAYWDAETIEAEMEGWPVPVWSRKADTDACFERMTGAIVDAIPRSLGEGGINLALGSHNVRSIANALALIDRADLPRSAIELQMLHGMADQLKSAATQLDLRIREYVPVGEMIPGMAYLVRRLLENTSNESWLKAGFLDNASPDELLAAPVTTPVDDDPGVDRIASAPERHMLSPAVDGVDDGRPFFTEPYRDFSRRDLRDNFAATLKKSVVPEIAIDATVADSDRAIAVAHTAFPRWRDTPCVDRSGMLIRCADLMRRRRDELSGIIIRESGKIWREADADVCEAIDFCTYYARMAPELFAPRRMGQFIGELDQQWSQGRGVAAVIAPWNFPLAICAGMTTAALVTGNTVIVKPAEQTPGIARVFCEMLWEAGVPRDVLHFLPGQGETVGAHLVRDPRVALIAFTGSRDVGLDIIRAAGETHPDQASVKKVICEMGGKNAIIVDASADLDEAVLGVRNSAFAFQGQKCSACSRVIVLDTAHDTFVSRLIESTRTLLVDDPLKPGTDIGPVIDEAAAAKIRSYIQIGGDESTLALGGNAPAGLEAAVGKPYVAPHIFTEVDPDARIARDEIFGPVLGVLKVSSFDEALAVANDSAYKLTGGVYSRKPSHLEQARREYRVGNLYLNRGCTGALVGRHPFGGFGMSGVGSKAGGEDYLRQFVEPRACAENTMRRGFAPGL